MNSISCILAVLFGTVWGKAGLFPQMKEALLLMLALVQLL